MEKIEHELLEDTDARKKSHIDLAFLAQNSLLDSRFYYEPMLAGHPVMGEIPFKFGEKIMKYPLWISSMTGGTSSAKSINRILATTAKRYGLGMGLGSCRIIIENDTYLEDFNLRPILGDSCPLYVNIGIAQVEALLLKRQVSKLIKLVRRLDADGVIVHVNPLQEWIQPEGDHIQQAPIITIKELLNEIEIPLIVKEVGQGFGPESMKELLKLPLLAIDFAANGGTNFSKLELLRNEALIEYYQDVVALGHSATEMLDFLNMLVKDLGDLCKCQNVIISGGLKNFLSGYHLISKSKLPAVYGQASQFLKHAMISQEALDTYVEREIKGLLLARNFLKVR